MSVIRFPLHHFHHCDRHDCYICNGSLGFCTTCRGAEGTLPTDCSGEPMTNEQEKAVYAGLIDFSYREGWIDGPAVKAVAK